MQQLSLIRLDFASPLVPGRSSIVPGGPKEFKVPVSGLKEGKIGALDLSAPRQTFSGACHALLPNVTVVRSSALEKSMLKVSILLLSRAPLSQKSFVRAPNGERQQKIRGFRATKTPISDFM